MPVSSHTTPDGGGVTISIQGRFDYSVQQEFRHSYERGSSKVGSFVLDMRNTDYMDSSSLGMLLILRDFAGGESAIIRIINCSEEIRNILTIFNFDGMFEIS
jgi:anti-anti-sigma factor